MSRIIRNSVHCEECDEDIESRHTHDLRDCSGGHIAVDGGHAYLRRIYMVPDPRFTDTSIVEREPSDA